MKVVALALSFTLAACGGSALRTARRVVEYSAQAGDASDSVLAPAYADAARQALRDTVDAAEGMPEYRQRIEKWDAVAAAIVGLRGSLLTAERALDAWQSGDDSQWLQAAACIASALVRLRDTLVDVGLDLPASLNRALDMVDGIASGSCGQ